MIEVGPGKPVWAMGLMSGTSLDGVDAAMVLTDGEEIFEFGPSAFTPYDEGELGFLPEVHRDWRPYRNPSSEGLAYELKDAEAAVLGTHARSVVSLLMPGWPDAACIGFHGQTVAHCPEEGWTWQLGDGGELSRILRRPVVWDFRSADMEAGGEGAPLAPFFHFALARRIGAPEPLAFVNIGGVANVTWVDPRVSSPELPGALLAFDTGPGNALINDWVMRKAGQPFDRDGSLAASGEVDWMIVHTNNAASAYQERKPPKSLDRNDFASFLRMVEPLSVADGAATLAAVTVEAIAASRQHMPVAPSRWLICGGGRRNSALMSGLAEALQVPVDPVEAVGLDGDMLEAQAFAWLAVRVLRGLPTSAPSTTGCREPISGGQVSYPQI